MTSVAILPTPTEKGGVSYTAVAGNKRSNGSTAGEALDALTAQLSREESGTLVVIQTQRPDAFFDAAQKQRMVHLMGLWRTARDQGRALAAEDQAELDALVEAELLASAARASALADELGK